MSQRFTRFTMKLSRLNKLIQKLKADGMSPYGLKAVDTLCIYQLAEHGALSFSEVAEQCDLDPALVSRTLRELVKNGMVDKQGQPGKYNATYCLTPLGAERAAAIRAVITAVQERADEGITTEELAVFYRVLTRLTENFEAMARDPGFLAGGEKEN